MADGVCEPDNCRRCPWEWGYEVAWCSGPGLSLASGPTLECASLRSPPGPWRAAYCRHYLSGRGMPRRSELAGVVAGNKTPTTP